MVDKTNIGKPGGPDDNNDREERDEELLENYLDGDSSVSEAYRELTQVEPPDVLDRAVLEMAREAALPRRKSLLDIDLMFWRHWARPISMVVIMGVCLTVVLRVMDYKMLPPTPDQEAAFALATPALDQAIKQEQPESPAAAKVPPATASSARFKASTLSVTTQPAPEQAAEKPARAARDTYMEEIIVTERKREESLQEVPLSITAFQNEQIVVTARRSHENIAETVPADSALEAWQQGTQPAADVWLAGIETLYMSSDSDSLAESADDSSGIAYDLPYAEPADIEIELKKMARIYPVETRQFRVHKSLITVTATTETAQMKVRRQIVPRQTENGAEMDASPLLADEPAGLFIDPYVWAAGIDWLYENQRDAEAKAEQEKLRLIYPEFRPE